MHYIHELFRMTVKYVSEVKHQTISKCPHWDNPPPPQHLKIDLDHGNKNKWWFNQNKIGGQLQCCVHASVGELSDLARLGMHSHMTVKQCIIQLNLKDHALPHTHHKVWLSETPQARTLIACTERLNCLLYHSNLYDFLILLLSFGNWDQEKVVSVAKSVKTICWRY